VDQFRTGARLAQHPMLTRLSGGRADEPRAPASASA